MTGPYYATEYNGAATGARDEAFARLLQGLEAFLYLFLIFQFSNGFVAVLLLDPNNPEYISPMGRVIWYPAYALVMVLLLLRLPQTLRLAVFNPLLVLCVLWCALSVLWSVDGAITFRRVIALTMTTLFGVLLAARYHWSGMLQRLALVYGFLALSSLLMGILVPKYGIMHEIHVGAWRGVWSEKNYMGGAMTKGLLVMICAYAVRPDRGWLWIPGGLLCFLMVLLSTSKTALLISLIMIGGFLALKIYRTYPAFRFPLVWGFVFVIAAFASLMAAVPNEMFALIGKDPTFTGRTDIWNGLIESIRQRPWTGYGYGVYWLDPMGPSYTVRRALEWGVPSAHNGWLEIWLSAGAPAVALFGLLLVVSLIFAFHRVSFGGAETYWAVLSLVMFILFSLSESTILQRNDLSWVMFVATTTKLFAFERPWVKGKTGLPYFLQGVVRDS